MTTRTPHGIVMMYAPRYRPTGCVANCSCPWWYWYDAERRAWYVSRLCGGSVVEVTNPTSLGPAAYEARAISAAAALNRAYGIADPRSE